MVVEEAPFRTQKFRFAPDKWNIDMIRRHPNLDHRITFGERPSSGMPMARCRRRWSPAGRDGAAAVECALCIPVVVVLMIGTLSVCSDIYLKETLTVAAFEGARSAVRRRATPEIAIASAENILTARGIVNGSVTVSPSDFSDLQAMDEITVLVSAPVEGNSFFSWNAILPTRYVSAQVTMVREFDD